MDKYIEIISFEYFSKTNSVSIVFETGVKDENGKKYKDISKGRISFSQLNNTKKDLENFLGCKENKIYKMINIAWCK